MNLRLIFFTTAISFFLSLVGTSAETIYSWTDEHGVRHMTNVPPVQPNKNVKEFEVKPPQIVGEPEIQSAEPDDKLKNKLKTPVSITGNHVIVPVTLSYGKKKIKTRMLLDTGATNITLHRKIAKKLSVKNTRKGFIRVAGGDLIEAEGFILDSVTVGPHTKKNLLAGIIENSGPRLEYDGLLGMNFLRNLQYTIDFNNRMLDWYK